MARKRSGPNVKEISTLALGKRIKSIRTEKGMSIQRLADILGVQRSYISQLETGDRTPSFGTLIDIINYLEIPPNELLYDYLTIKSAQVPLNSLTRKLEGATAEQLQRIEAHALLELELSQNNEAE